MACLWCQSGGSPESPVRSEFPAPSDRSLRSVGVEEKVEGVFLASPEEDQKESGVSGLTPESLVCLHRSLRCKQLATARIEDGYKYPSPTLERVSSTRIEEP